MQADGRSATGRALGMAGVLMAHGLKVPTYSSRETCEETLSFAAGELLRRSTERNAHAIRESAEKFGMENVRLALQLVDDGELAIDEDGTFDYWPITESGEVAKLDATIRCRQYRRH